MNLILMVLLIAVCVAISMHVIYTFWVHLFTVLSCSKVEGQYGEYYYHISQYGWSSYKVAYHRPHKWLGLITLQDSGTFFGETEGILHFNEEMSPEDVKSWVKRGIIKYEDHLKLWGKL